MDELQSLKELFPEPLPAAEPVVQRQREALMTVIEQSTDTRWRRVRPRHLRRRVAIVVVPAMAVTLAAAGWAVLREDATEAAAFACIGDGVTAVLPNDGTPPVAACRARWEAGHIENVTQAPPLVACVNEAGAVAVIAAETSNACEAAGMAEWAQQEEYEAVGAAVRSSLVSFHDRFKATGNACATEEDWRNALNQHLQQSDIVAWNVEVDRIRSDRRCLGLGSINPKTMTVQLVGHPGNESIGCDPRTGC